MRIIVCLKQVLDAAALRVSSRGELDSRDATKVTNPADLCALEEALKIKDERGAELIALTLGAPEAEDVLREALAMGADRAILLVDSLFAAGDAHTVSYALAQAVRCLGSVDIVLAGVRSSDDGGGQVGPQIAELLGWSQITEAQGLDVAEGRAGASKVFEDGTRRISVARPAVITIPAGSNQPRLATTASIMSVYQERTIETWSAADISADAACLGPDAALTMVRRTFAPDAAAKGDVLTGPAQEAATALVARLRRRGLL